MPAESAYLSVLRTATAGLAARLDFTLDEIEDLRIAIDEACAMLLAQAIPGTDLECGFELGADQVTITVSVTAAQPKMPARDTFAWTVLSALAGTVDSRLGPGDRVSIVLVKRRRGATIPRPTGHGPASCSNGSRRCRMTTRSARGSGPPWSSCTCRSWSTWRAGSATGASGLTISPRSRPSG